MTAQNPQPSAHKLSFSEQYSSESYVMLELSEDVFDKVDAVEMRLFVRGCSEDFAVLCSETRTYEMKLRESSNTMLLCSNILCPDNTDPDPSRQTADLQVDGMQHRFLELRQITPRWNRAKHILEATPFQGIEYETEVDGEQKCSLDELQDSLQSSQAELLHYLQNIIYSCEIDGFWRILTHEYIARLIQRVVSWLQYSSLTWDSIPMMEAGEALTGLEPAEVMENFFWPRFSIRNNGHTLQLNREAIACALVTSFLRTGVKVYCDEVVRWWRSTIPFDLEFDEKLLAGIARNDHHGVTPSYCYFPKDDLPTVPETRFMLLFKERSQWSREELIPFISDIVTEGQSVEKLLHKYAKAFNEDGKTFFVASSLI